MVFAQTMTRTSVPQAAQRLGMTSHIGNAAPLLPMRAPLRPARVARTSVIPQARGKLDPVRVLASPQHQLGPIYSNRVHGTPQCA